MDSDSQTKVDPRKQALLEARFFGSGREDIEVNQFDQDITPTISPNSQPFIPIPPTLPVHLQGLQGLQGVQGLQGLQGVQGGQGFQGVQGVHAPSSPQQAPRPSLPGIGRGTPCLPPGSGRQMPPSPTMKDPKRMRKESGARFDMNDMNKGGVQKFLPDGEHSNPLINMSSNFSQDSNLSTGSVASDDGKSAQDPSPDKTPNAKTPKERKRKRKNGDDNNEGSQSSKPGRKTSDNNRTINDYFGKPTSSPGRAHGGAKSPSPSSNQFLPCSPQPSFIPGMGDYRMQPPAPRPG
jgi:hypothetical protein